MFSQAVFPDECPPGNVPPLRPGRPVRAGDSRRADDAAVRGSRPPVPGMLRARVTERVLSSSPRVTAFVAGVGRAIRRGLRSTGASRSRPRHARCTADLPRVHGFPGRSDGGRPRLRVRTVSGGKSPLSRSRHAFFFHGECVVRTSLLPRFSPSMPLDDSYGRSFLSGARRLIPGCGSSGFLFSTYDKLGK